jgi:hypothetical protein
MSDAGEPQRCHCARGWFNPDVYDECAQCRRALVDAINAARRLLGGRVVGTHRSRTRAFNSLPRATANPLAHNRKH